MEIEIHRFDIHEKETGATCQLAVHFAGKPANPPLICVHGLTRNATDFYTLADALASDYYVMMPDVPGRGESANLPYPAMYNNGFYSLVFAQWMDEQGFKKLPWIGTSMGGLIGMILAATRRDLIAKMLINDIGHIIPAAALAHIKTYVGVNTEDDDYNALAQVVQTNLLPFGIQDPLILNEFIAATIKECEQGGYRMNYDPAIREAFMDIPNEDADISDIWKLITCPMLVFRGEKSQLLPKEVAQKMIESKEKIELFEVAGAGHAPSLTTAAEIRKISRWLGDS